MKQLLCALPLLLACAERPSPMSWPGAVDAEVDNLTGERTGLFRTFGPTQDLAAGSDRIPVTLGYWCRIADDESDPRRVSDGLFFRIAMPDTSLVLDDRPAFENVSGQLGLLDVARMAVDGRVYAWEYDVRGLYGGWDIEGRMGIGPSDQLNTPDKRNDALEALAFWHGPEGMEYVLRQSRLSPDAKMRLYQARRREVESIFVEGTAPAADYVTSHYVGRDTIAIELNGVLAYPMDGFGAAVDSVRFWCPVVESQRDWNRVRTEYRRAMDSVRTENRRAMDSVRTASLERR